MAHPLHLHPLLRALLNGPNLRPAHALLLANLSERAKSIELTHHGHCVVPYVTVLVKPQEHVLEKRDEPLTIGELVARQLSRERAQFG